MKWYVASGLVAAIFAAFAVVHSLLVADTAKSLARRLMGENFVRSYYRLIYTVISAVTTALAIHLIFLIPDKTLLSPPMWMKISGHAMQALGLAVGAAAFGNFHLGEFLGLSQAARASRGEKQPGDEEGLRQRLVTTGIYGVVRHPMYLAGILLFTFNPYLTRNWLTVSVMADIYFLIGAFIEERRLLRRFGDDYRGYMEGVPRFVPRIF